MPLSLLPNLLTASRAAAALVILFDSAPVTVAWLIAWAALSDFLDGWLARRLGTASASGATFDLTVDALFFLACFVGFWRTGVIPSGWFAAILAAVIPEVIAQALFLRRRSGVGSPGRGWNKILGGYSVLLCGRSFSWWQRLLARCSAGIPRVGRERTGSEGGAQPRTPHRFPRRWPAGRRVSLTRLHRVLAGRLLAGGHPPTMARTNQEVPNQDREAFRARPGDDADSWPLTCERRRRLP